MEIALDEHDSRSGMCAVALIENVAGEVRVSRQVRHFGRHRQMDQACDWGLRWTAGSKD